MRRAHNMTPDGQNEQGAESRGTMSAMTATKKRSPKYYVAGGVDTRPGWVYAIKAPDGQVVYIGKTGISVHRRWWQHRHGFKKGNESLCNNWKLRELWYKHKRKLTCVTLEECQSGKMDEAEKYWIAHYKFQGLELANYTDGGEVFSDATRKKLSDYTKRKWQDPEYKRKWLAGIRKSHGEHWGTGHRPKSRARGGNRHRPWLERCTEEDMRALRRARAGRINGNGYTILGTACVTRRKDRVGYVPTSSGRYVVVSAKDLDKVGSLHWKVNSKGHVQNNKVGMMSRYIMQPSEDQTVVRMSADTFDLRRSMMRVVDGRGMRTCSSWRRADRFASSVWYDVSASGQRA